MNTAEERAEAAAIDVEGRQARIAEILNPPLTMIQHGEQAGKMTAQPITDLQKPTRRSPIKGLCVNCNKHWSRHHYDNERNVAYCDSDRDMWFSTEPAPKAEPAAQVAGALSQEQIEHIRTLAEAKIQALDANTKAEQAMMEACVEFDVYLDSLKAK